MKKADCYHLGYVAKLHGFKGEVSLFLDVSNPNEYKKLPNVYIEVNGQLIPHFTESYQLTNKGYAIAKFEGVNTENEAKVLVRKNLYLPLEELPPLTGKHFYDHEVVGFDVEDKRLGVVGTLTQIIDLAVNPLIQVDAQGKEVLLPFVPGLIIEVDRANKILKIDAPEGLIEMYLEA